MSRGDFMRFVIKITYAALYTKFRTKTFSDRARSFVMDSRDFE